MNIPEDTIERLRELMPVGTLNMLARSLTPQEARIVAERQATLLLELLGITTPSVDVELVMELPNIEVEVIPDLPQSGLSSWEKDHWLIKINADDSLWRCRATLAHELKHVLDDPFVELLYPGYLPYREHAPEAEFICEYFAGCVLVPRKWLIDTWENGQHDPAALAGLFDVSEALIRVRLRQVGLLPRRDNHANWSEKRRPYRRAKPCSDQQGSTAKRGVASMVAQSQLVAVRTRAPV